MVNFLLEILTQTVEVSLNKDLNPLINSHWTVKNNINKYK